MSTEKAGAWKEQEHISEKKAVLENVNQKLEGKSVAGELPGLIADIANYRYPQDPEFSRRQAKRQSFDNAITQVAGICRTDRDLSKYGIEKKDILEWCEVPMLEDSQPGTWESMAKLRSFSLMQNADLPPNHVAENLIAMKTGSSKIGLSPELMKDCEMTVRQRDTSSFWDRLYGLPQPEQGKTSHIVTLEFNFEGEKIKIFYDSDNPSVVRLDGLIALTDKNPVSVDTVVHLGPDYKITKCEGTDHGLLLPGGDISTFLRMLKLASQDKSTV